MVSVLIAAEATNGFLLGVGVSGIDESESQISQETKQWSN